MGGETVLPVMMVLWILGAILGGALLLIIALYVLRVIYEGSKFVLEFSSGILELDIPLAIGMFLWFCILSFVFTTPIGWFIIILTGVLEVFDPE